MHPSVVRVLQAAKAIKMSEAAICKAVGANRNHVDDWKKNKSTPSVDEVSILSNLFNVTTDYLLGLTDNPTRDATPSEEHWLVRAYGRASDNIQRSIKAQLEPYMEETAQETNPTKKAV